MLQGERTGRLLRYDPGTGRTSLLAHGFWYSNGVTLAKDESFALVVETCTLKVHRIWLKGPRVSSCSTAFGSGLVFKTRRPKHAKENVPAEPEFRPFSPAIASTS